MSANVWLIIAIVFFVISAVMAVVAVFVFIKLNIPEVIGDLTGKTAAREIELIRQLNEESGVKKHIPSPVNIQRGTLTDKVGTTAKSSAKGFSSVGHADQRLDKSVKKADKGQISKQSLKSANIKTDMLAQSSTTDEITAALTTDDGTTKLADANLQNTEVLSQDKTDVLNNTQATEILADNANQPVYKEGITDTLEPLGTTVLAKENLTDKKDDSFVVVRSVVFAESEEVIV